MSRHKLAILATIGVVVAVLLWLNSYPGTVIYNGVPMTWKEMEEQRRRSAHPGPCCDGSMSHDHGTPEVCAMSRLPSIYAIDGFLGSCSPPPGSEPPAMVKNHPGIKRVSVVRPGVWDEGVAELLAEASVRFTMQDFVKFIDDAIKGGYICARTGMAQPLRFKSRTQAQTRGELQITDVGIFIPEHPHGISLTKVVALRYTFDLASSSLRCGFVAPRSGN